MEKPKTHLSELLGNAVDYLETRIQIAKLDAADAGASAASSMLTWIILVFASAIMLLFFSIGAALGIGYLLDNHALGFVITGGVYFIAVAMLYSYRKDWLRKPIGNKIIESIYDND
ncbi:MAG: phage holin family protein [Bacteroidia bacterium]|nr:phage holin family protein [Bacteroidota bacterium]MBP9081841.1 phage holin family protein [Bacteroidia bacterium]MBK7387793.1 phage holin family protein [Bacteroidota bacterium]MBK7971141.1 phage holin family protein [Bacteroidota bacterium]MBK8415541.1 phage holin family protein [Bacteroidota bacterium]